MEGRGGRVAGLRKRSLLQPPLTGREFRRLMDGELKEKEWQAQVEEALQLYRWKPWHAPPNVVVCDGCRRKLYRNVRKGFPDLFAMRPPYLLWIELKTERGQLEPEQREFLDDLRACGQIVLHARPRDRERLFNVIAHPEQWNGEEA